MAARRGKKRRFLLVEVLAALSLLSIVLLPCVRFYCGLHSRIAEDILDLQLPHVIDNCFFAIEDRIREQIAEGSSLSYVGQGELPYTISTYRGRPLVVSYRYLLSLRKPLREDVCLVDVTVEVFPNQKHATTARRSLCITR